MAIFDIFKKKKAAAKPQKTVKEVKIEEPKPVQKKEAKRGMASVYNVVAKPHISEKSTDMSKVNQYVFEVFPEANKNKVKEAIEIIYGVDVLAVNIIKIPAKKRKLGRSQGFRKGYKKAVVTIKEGQKIEIL